MTLNQVKTCAVVACERARVTDSLVCGDHLNEMFGNRLDRTPAGFVAREPEWMCRRRTIGLPPKDMSAA